jgi:hypothetical protein
MIPPFGEQGLLPAREHDLPYDCTADEIRQRFVVDLGSPAWRQALFDGWSLLRAATADFVPSARWWLWGCFVSSHEEPLFGEAETLSSIVILPASDLPPERHRLAMLLDFLGSAQQRHRVDVGIVYEFATQHPSYLDTVEALDFKWRPRASQNIADHATKLLVRAGYLEVQS